jgi:hypothetical protein
MNKAFAIALLLVVSWAVAGTVAQAAESSQHGLALVKHHKKHPHHKGKHKKA